jgi:hypothetical protein
MAQYDPDVVTRSRAATGGLLAAMAFFLAIPSGCSDASSVDAPVMPEGRLWIGPADGATNLDVNTIALFVQKEAVSDAEVSALANHMGLRTWPEQTVVASTTAEDYDSFTDSKMLRVVPAAPLEERWYLMAVTNLLDGSVSWRTPQGQANLMARFRIGSFPIVRAIELCEKEPSGMAFIVHVSEPVEAELPAEEIISITQNGTELACELTGTSPEGSFSFYCPELTLTLSEVTVGTGLKAPTGATVPPGSFIIDMNSLSPASSGCSEFHPPI